MKFLGLRLAVIWDWMFLASIFLMIWWLGFNNLSCFRMLILGLLDLFSKLLKDFLKFRVGLVNMFGVELRYC
jgi:hypothetical protein